VRAGRKSGLIISQQFQSASPAVDWFNAALEGYVRVANDALCAVYANRIWRNHALAHRVN